MPGKTALVSLCAAAILMGVLVIGCGKDYRQIAVINGDKAEIVTYGPPPRKEGKVWQAGRILVFRTSSPVPGAPANITGQAGHVYRVTDDMTLEEVTEFQPSVPNDTLAYTYGK